MKNFIFTIFIAFLISLLIHVVLYITLNENIQNNKLLISTTNKIQDNKKTGYTAVKFVRLKKEEPKRVEKPKKVVSKPKKKKTLAKKVKIKKEIKAIQLPKKTKEVDLKKFFTIQKSQENIEKQEAEVTKRRQVEEELKKVRQLDPLTQSFIKLYGEEYFAYSDKQRKYLRNNLNKIGKITQNYLEYPILSLRTKQSGINVVEFLFHPNGDITDLKLTDSSYYTALDQNSIETIELAYKDYPRPSETVKIKIYIKYILN